MVSPKLLPDGDSGPDGGAGRVLAVFAVLVGAIVLALAYVVAGTPGLGGETAGPLAYLGLGRAGAPTAGSETNLPSVGNAGPVARLPDIQRDFTSCWSVGETTSGAEIFDPGVAFGGVWQGNGCAMRFLNSGQSWMQVDFAFDSAPRATGRVPQDFPQPIWELAFYHLSSSPDGVRPGYSPVRVTLNGTRVWEGSPGSSGVDPGETGVGPGGLWTLNRIDVSTVLREGSNTLRWEFLDGATTHYWLKSIRIWLAAFTNPSR